MITLINRHSVGFVAEQLHQDQFGVIWAFLGNGMICSFDRKTGIEADHFESKRFAAAYFGDHFCLLATWENEIQRFAYDAAEIEQLHSTSSPASLIAVDRTSGKHALVANDKLVTFNRAGQELAEAQLPFKPWSLIFLNPDELLVGGSGLAKLNVGLNRPTIIEEKFPVLAFDLARCPTSGCLAVAARDHLAVYNSSFQKQLVVDMEARYCTFTNGGELCVSLSTDEQTDPKLEIVSLGLDSDTLVLSSGAFAIDESGLVKRVFVSGYLSLLQYEFDFQEL